MSSARDHVTIGILGTKLPGPEPHAMYRSHHLCTAALQGAFAEHQVMLQKVSLKKRIVVALIRQQEDLEKCDALIIPGGGNVPYPSNTHRLTYHFP